MNGIIVQEQKLSGSNRVEGVQSVVKWHVLECR
jgi:hypothetical protein